MSRGEYIPNTATKLLLHMNGDSTDTSGGGNNGTDANITYSQANGKFNQGAGFNGSSSKITLSVKVIPLGAKTISLWINTTKADYQYLIDEAAGTTTNKGMSIRLNPAGTISTFRVYGAGGSNYSWLLTGAKVLKDGKWHNIIFTWDGTTTSNMVKVYVDGQLDIQGTSINTETTANTYNTRFGVTADAANFGWVLGGADEIIIDNIAWTASQIKKYYTGATKGFI